MNNDISIRIATEEDIPWICQVQKETWIDTYPNEEYGITVEDRQIQGFNAPLN